MNGFETFLSEMWQIDANAIIDMGLRLLKALIVFVAGNVVWRVARKIFAGATSGRFRWDESLNALLKMLTKYGIIIICAIIILDIFGMNTASLIAILGTAGVAIGLSLKDTLSNIAASIVLMVTHSYKKGDYIDFGGTAGTVEEIDLFTTLLHTPEGVCISAPNSKIWAAVLKNYSRNSSRIEIALTIPEGKDPGTALEFFGHLIAEEKRFLKDPAPQVVVSYPLCISLQAWTTAKQACALAEELKKTTEERFADSLIIKVQPADKEKR
jgi:small conductance mechanosensitive channel